jgi:ATP-binding cassette, subfamily B (MDR/TAP), member 1
MSLDKKSLTFSSYIHDLQTATSQPLSMTIQYSGTTLASFGLAFYLSWKLTLVTLAGIPVVIILIPMFSSRFQSALQQQAFKLSQAAKLATTIFSAIETIKFYNGEDFELWKYSNVIKESGRFFFQQTLWSSLQAGVLRVITLSMFVQGFWFGNVMLDNGQITCSTILTSFWAAMLAVQATMQMMQRLAALEKGRAAGQKLRVAMVQMSLSPMQLALTSLQKPGMCVGDIAFKKVRQCQPIEYSPD